jgi:Tol biopolymer transport system component
LDVSIIDADSGVSSLLTFDDVSDEAPIWSPSGSHIVFSSARGGLQFLPHALYRRAVDGTGADELLFSGARTELMLPFDWSRDGAHIVFGRSHNWGKDVDLWVLPVARKGDPFPLLASASREGFAKLSPDGRFIAYVTNVTGRDEVFVQPFPEVDRGKWKVSSNGGSLPRWRRDGGELFYVGLDGVLMAMDVETDGDALVPREPHALFSTGIDPRGYAADSYDVTADGERFLVGEAVPAANDAAEHGASRAAADIPIHVIVNWMTALDSE